MVEQTWPVRSSRVRQPLRPGWRAADRWWGYLFILPQLLGFLVFVLGPLVYVFVYSLQARNLLSGETSFVGLANYAQLVSGDPLFQQTLANSLLFAAGNVPLNIGLSLGLALLLHPKLKGVTLFRTLFFAPVITSAVAWAIVWKFMLQGDQGVVNQLLAGAGFEGPNWLREPGWAMFWVIFTRVIKNIGLNLVIFMAALANIPPEYSDAASVDGANPWQVLRHVTLPILAPTTLMVSIITVIGSFKVFDTIVLMTGGGPANATMVLVYYIYFQAFRNFETGYASSLAVVLFVITLALTLVQWRLRKRLSYVEH